MKFEIDPEFASYWQPLPEKKLILLERSILEEGIRENLIVWEEENILLDGHQRFRICEKHNIPIDDKITYLSFPDAIHAKHWIHITQAARRGDAPQFLSICHVLEFEPIYKEEAEKRMLAGKKTLSTNGAEGGGQSRKFMARDAAASKNSVERVLYIKKHDFKRFVELEEIAKKGLEYNNDDGKGRGKGKNEISIHLEWAKVKAFVDAKSAGVTLDPNILEKFSSTTTVQNFAETISKYKPPAQVQKAAAEAIIANQTIADKNYIEDEVIHRMPKRKSCKEKEKPEFEQIENSMRVIAKFLYQAIEETRNLMQLRKDFGDDLYFQALVNAHDLRAAFAEWVVQAKYINKKGDINEKKEIKKIRLLH